VKELARVKRGNSNGKLTLAQTLELLHNHLSACVTKVRNLEGMPETGTVKDLYQTRVRAMTSAANTRAVDDAFPAHSARPVPISSRLECAVTYSKSNEIGKPLTEAHRKALETLGAVSAPVNIIAAYCDLTGLGRNKDAYNKMTQALLLRAEEGTSIRNSLLNSRDKLSGNRSFMRRFVFNGLFYAPLLLII
jgi:hypothetical protein